MSSGPTAACPESSVQPILPRKHREVVDQEGPKLGPNKLGRVKMCTERWRVSGRRRSRRCPSTTELGGDVLRGGDGPSGPHGSAAAGADRDVDAEDAGQERHPGQPGGCGGTQLSLQQAARWDGGQLELPARDEQRELLGLGVESLMRGTMAQRNAWLADPKDVSHGPGPRPQCRSKRWPVCALPDCDRPQQRAVWLTAVSSAMGAAPSRT